MGFSRPEYWSGLPFPSPGDLPNPGTEPMSPVSSALQVDSLLVEASGKLKTKISQIKCGKSYEEMKHDRLISLGQQRQRTATLGGESESSRTYERI